jgi:hypothetical protein
MKEVNPTNLWNEFRGLSSEPGTDIVGDEDRTEMQP